MMPLWEHYLILCLCLIYFVIRLLLFVGGAIAKQKFTNQERAKPGVGENPNSNIEGKTTIKLTKVGLIYMITAMAVAFYCTLQSDADPNLDQSYFARRARDRVNNWEVIAGFLIPGTMLHLIGVKMYEKKEAGPREF